MWHPIMQIKYKVFLTSAGVALDSTSIDKDYTERLAKLIRSIRPYVLRFLLPSCLSFEAFHGENIFCSQWTGGMMLTERTPPLLISKYPLCIRPRPDLTGLYVPNEYMMEIVVRF